MHHSITGLSLLSFLACAPPHPTSWRHAGAAMGTTWAVQAPGLPEGVDDQALSVELEAIVRGVDARMSTWDPNSELSRFNAVDGTDWFEVSGDTRTVVDEALHVAELTGGAFDPTVGPLVACWGFGPGGRGPDGEPPGCEELEALRAHVGHQLVETRAVPPALRKAHAAVRIDLSAIAKGFAIDRVAEHLVARGVEDFLVELGGELRARGRSASGARWRVAIEAPDPDLVSRSRAQRVMELDDAAIATSGDARNAFERSGQRYSHVIDPRTGRPVQLDIASASVIAASAMRADALATALMVLGPVDGLRLAEREGVDALLIVRAGKEWREYATTGFLKRGGFQTKEGAP